MTATKLCHLKEVRFLRIEADLPQKELAAKLGVTDRTVSLWERDHQPIQRAESLVLELHHPGLKAAASR